jgi:DNA-binding transcriptional ArsR family regulator
MDAFAVLGAPARRLILAELRRAPSSVTRLADVLDQNQPAVSKHLKVLREAGFVVCRGAGQQRIYALDVRPLQEVDAWLEPYRRLWERHLDALERFLDTREKTDAQTRLSAGRAGKRTRRTRR